MKYEDIINALESQNNLLRQSNLVVGTILIVSLIANAIFISSLIH
jgi:hypothetical protein